jgi:putative hydrolase of the HAD superfamily
VVRAVLFDVAGTLLGLREPVGRTYARLAREFGIERSEASLQEAFARAFAAMPPMVFPTATPAEAAESERRWWYHLVERTFGGGGAGAAGFGGDAHRSRLSQAKAAHGGKPQITADFDSFFARLFTHYAGPQAWASAPGARDVLASLRRLGLATGVVSNFDQRLHALLDAFDLRELLDIVVLPADAGAAKPDPRIFALALSRLAVRAEEAVYVGDDEVEDLRAAEALGMHVIDVTRLANLGDLPQRIRIEEAR